MSEKGIKAKAAQQDGQHRDVISCGCHTFLKKLVILKQEILKPGRNILKELIEPVKKRKIYKYCTNIMLHFKFCL